VPRERLVAVIDALEPKPCTTIDLRQHFRRTGDCLVHVQQAGELLRIAMLREGVVGGHRAVNAAGLQHGVIDPGIGHLRQHQLRRRLKILHSDRHVLDVALLAVHAELDPTEPADAQIHVGEAVPRPVVLVQQRLRPDTASVMRREAVRHGEGQTALQVFEMDVVARVPAIVVPVLDDMGMAIDDHVNRTNMLRTLDGRAHRGQPPEVAHPVPILNDGSRGTGGVPCR
jgi:hypothetical protein